MTISKEFRSTGVVYHLHKDSSISEWKINEHINIGRPNRKITEINGLLEEVVLFDRLERTFQTVYFVPFTVLFLGCSTTVCIKQSLVFEIQISHNYSDLIVLK